MENPTISRTGLEKEFMRCFNSLCGSKSPYAVWSDFIAITAIVIQNNATKEVYKSNPVLFKTWNKREERYKVLISRYNNSERGTIIRMFSILQFMFVDWDGTYRYDDVLGRIYMELGISSKNSGQFFTPYDLSLALAKLSIVQDRKQFGMDLRKKGFVSINDSACGAGSTLIAAAECCNDEFHKLNYRNHVLFTGADIDETVALMCYIQLCALDLPGYIIVTDTLTKPDVDFWKESDNVWVTPKYLGEVWQGRIFAHGWCHKFLIS